jgi:hypothetical protein
MVKIVVRIFYTKAAGNRPVLSFPQTYSRLKCCDIHASVSEKRCRAHDLSRSRRMCLRLKAV